MTIYTETDIRSMDDATLTQLAYDLGLAPASVSPYGTDLWICEQEAGPWEPSRNLAQAEALFRQLRARGWITRNTFDPSEHRGSVTVMRPDTEPGTADLQTMCSAGYATEREEARALVLVSVLALASEQQQKDE